jgi:hypothetical protein
MGPQCYTSTIISTVRTQKTNPVTKTDLETNKTYQPGIVKIIYSKVAKATLQPVHSILICKTMEPAMVSAQFAVMYQVK